MKKLACLIAVCGSICAWHYTHRPITYAPGVLISAEPEQTATSDAAIHYGEFTLRPLAHFALNARVLHRKVYRYDREAALVPVDVALGWGAMSDQAVLDRLTISQSMRFYWFEYRLPPPIPKDQIISHSTNAHIIPSTPAIARACKSLRAGTLVHLDGDLVEASAPNFGPWRSSLSRTDSGNGACELIWLKQITVLDPDRSRAAGIIASR